MDIMTQATVVTYDTFGYRTDVDFKNSHIERAEQRLATAFLPNREDVATLVDYVMSEEIEDAVFGVSLKDVTGSMRTFGSLLNSLDTAVPSFFGGNVAAGSTFVDMLAFSFPVVDGLDTPERVIDNTCNGMRRISPAPFLLRLNGEKELDQDCIPTLTPARIGGATNARDAVYAFLCYCETVNSAFLAQELTAPTFKLVFWGDGGDTSSIITIKKLAQKFASLKGLKIEISIIGFTTSSDTRQAKSDRASLLEIAKAVGADKRYLWVDETNPETEAPYTTKELLTRLIGLARLSQQNPEAFRAMVEQSYGEGDGYPAADFTTTFRLDEVDGDRTES